MAEYIKCNNCKGTGRVPGGGHKRFVKCPICNGTGKKLVRKKKNKITIRYAKYTCSFMRGE